MSNEFAALSHSLEGQSVEAILRDAAARFPGRLTFATGLGVEDVVLIDVIGRHKLDVDLFSLDTGVLFPETYDLWKRLEAQYGIKIRAAKTDVSLEEQATQFGAALWEREPDKCCQIRKVSVLNAEVRKFDAWISAIRRDQTPDRADAQVVERDKRFGLVKINPLVTWTSRDVWNYVVKNGLPYNPLHDQNYPSIGCAPCTSTVMPGEDPRAGRWRGKAKTECGLHAETVPAEKLTPLTANR